MQGRGISTKLPQAWVSGIALHYALEGKSSGTVQITGNSQGQDPGGARATDARAAPRPAGRKNRQGQQAERSGWSRRIIQHLLGRTTDAGLPFF